MSRVLFVFMLVGLSFLGVTRVALGVTIELNPSLDNTLYESTSGNESNGAGQFLFSGATNGGALRRALIEFDLSDIPSGATVTSASLDMAVSRSISGTQNTSLHRVTNAWGEGVSDASGQEGQGTVATTGDATWVNTFFTSSSWATPGGDFVAGASATTGVAGSGTTSTWGSTSAMVDDAQFWLDNPTSNHGWIVIGNEGAGGTAKQFNSRQGATAPQLTIEYSVVPEPTTAMLGVLLLTGLVGIGRRRS